MTIARGQLIDQAKRLDRSERWFRFLVDSKLIQKGVPKGKGRGRGQEWIYKEATTQRLIWIHKLNATFGYRGDALRFAVWWRCGGEPTFEVRRYIANILLKLRIRLRRKLEQEARRQAVQNNQGQVEKEEHNNGTVLGIVIDRKGISGSIEKLSVEDLFSPLINFETIPSEDLKQVASVLMSTVLSITPDDLGVEAHYLVTPIRQALLSFPHLGTLIIGVLQSIHDTAWVDKLVTRITDCPASELNEMREFVGSNLFLDGLLKYVVAWDYGNLCKMKPWKIARQGPWRLPAAAYRATMLLLLFQLKAVSGGLKLSELFPEEPPKYN